MKQCNDEPTVKDGLICYREIISFSKSSEEKNLRNSDHMCYKIRKCFIPNVTVITRSQNSCFTNFYYYPAVS